MTWRGRSLVRCWADEGQRQRTVISNERSHQTYPRFPKRGLFESVQNRRQASVSLHLEGGKSSAFGPSYVLSRAPTPVWLLKFRSSVPPQKGNVTERATTIALAFVAVLVSVNVP